MSSELENGVANYVHSSTDFVYFGPQTAKNRNGVLTHPTVGRHAGHRHASSNVNLLFVVMFVSAGHCPATTTQATTSAAETTALPVTDAESTDLPTTDPVGASTPIACKP